MIQDELQKVERQNEAVDAAVGDLRKISSASSQIMILVYDGDRTIFGCHNIDYGRVIGTVKTLKKDKETPRDTLADWGFVEKRPFPDPDIEPDDDEAEIEATAI